MNLAVYASVLVLAAVSTGQQVQVQTYITPVFKQREIAADVLRDFPGLCFASTLCFPIPPGETWPLTPFCGYSECILRNTTRGPPQLIEQVTDCGPLLKPEAGCTRIEPNREEDYPGCCVKYSCHVGIKLRPYNDEELAILDQQEKERITRLRQQHAAAGLGQQQIPTRRGHQQVPAGLGQQQIPVGQGQQQIPGPSRTAAGLV